MIESLKIYYDGACPLCRNYVRFLRIEKTAAHFELVNLREDKNKNNELKQLQIDTDLGMIVEVDQQTYHGDEAIFVLARLSSKSNFFNRLNAIVFSNRVLTALIYPLMRLVRNILLFFLGRSKLNPKAEDLSVFRIFTVVWGILGFTHFVVYLTQFNAPVFFTTVFIPIFGLLLVLNPGSKRIFSILCVVMIIDGWLQMPSFSNHTILKNFFLLTLIFVAIRHGLKGSTWSGFFNELAIGGRCLLVSMYIFGVFHKINSDFLNPESSCAVALWDAMPAPISFISSDSISFLIIYGTYFTELAILAMLIYKPLRHLGIFFGILFHSLLALSGYAFYPPFSTLTIALHVLFLGSSGQIIVSSPRWQSFEKKISSPFGICLLAVYCASILLFAWLGSYSHAAYIWLFGVIIFAYLLFQGHRTQKFRQRSRWTRLVSKNVSVNIISALFVFNCITPYLGLKTAQSMNMFANLRLESGSSNHLLIKNAPVPFDYLKDIVEITTSSGSPYFSYVKQANLRITYYDLLSRLDQNENVTVSYIRNDLEFKNMTAAGLQTDIEEVLHPLWFRKWFHFNPVDLEQPKKCALDR